MNDIINQYLTEAMGEHYHIRKGDIQIQSGCVVSVCECGHSAMAFKNNNFYTWEGLGKLWEWSIEQEWFDEYIEMYSEFSLSLSSVLKSIVKPENFANSVYNFLKELK